LAKSFRTKSSTKCRKIGFEGVLRIDFLNLHREISGITGDPVKNQKILVLEFFLAVGYRNPFANILFCSQMVATKMSGLQVGVEKKSNLI
jgi:hypothetical protein